MAPPGRVSRRSGGQERATSEQARWGFQLHSQPLGSIECILDDGSLPIDNNKVEPLMKRIAVA
jgi:hypothetical protein